MNVVKSSILGAKKMQSYVFSSTIQAARHELMLILDFQKCFLFIILGL